ncbi:MAG: 2-phospho-L-lactate guanylyltransferase [Methanosphaera sp.]|nr:2-phospho-L-lactate guanylyltransferase [Methanosphaera sp.]
MKKLVCIIPVSSFSNSKTRLSPFLSDSERRKLLKVMLKDIVSNIRGQVEDIILVSRDDGVLEYARQLNVSFVKEGEHENNFLNNALLDAIRNVRLNYPNHDILILPSDIPLVKPEHIESAKNSQTDLVLSPSKGGGTNLLLFNSDFDFIPLFGDMSYFNHMNEAYTSNMTVNIIESFYLSLDVNTNEDLGEILLHGMNTHTYEYLSNLNIIVKSSHGQERLDVKRKDEG